MATPLHVRVHESRATASRALYCLLALLLAPPSRNAGGDAASVAASEPMFAKAHVGSDPLAAAPPARLMMQPAGATAVHGGTAGTTGAAADDTVQRQYEAFPYPPVTLDLSAAANAAAFDARASEEASRLALFDHYVYGNQLLTARRPRSEICVAQCALHSNPVV